MTLVQRQILLAFFTVLFSVAVLMPAIPLAEVGAAGSRNAVVKLCAYIWLLIIIVDEISEAFALGGRKWWSDSWNRLDALTQTLAVVGIMLSIGARDKYDAASNRRWLHYSRMVLAIVTLLLWLRATRIFAHVKLLGPKLVMLQSMVADIVVFFCLLSSIWLGYGIAAVAIQQPWRGWDDDIIPDVIVRPYFQAYGELYLEEMLGETGCISDSLHGCESNGVLLIILLGLYVFVANVVLVNLLIAMMSSTYDRVEQASQEIWIFQDLNLLYEAERLSATPPPFNIFVNLWRGLQGVAHAFSKPKQQFSAVHRSFMKQERNQLQPDTISSLLQQKGGSASPLWLKTPGDGDVETERVRQLEQFSARHVNTILQEDRLQQIQDGLAGAIDGQVSMLVALVDALHIKVSATAKSERKFLSGFNMKRGSK